MEGINPLSFYYPNLSPKRFNELRRCLPKITQRMLILQLKELVQDGVIICHDYQEVPPKVDYYLSEQGLTLAPMLLAMSKWGGIPMRKNV